MRKRTVIWITMTALAGCLLGGCGSSDQAAEGTTVYEEGTQPALSDIDAKEYVELGQYTGLKIKKTEAEEVTDQDVEDYIEELAKDYMEYREIDRTEVKEDDYIKVNYTMTVNGEKAEDYSGEDFDMHLGEGYLNMLDTMDVDSQLVGASVGDTVTVDMEFPEEYDDSTYAGQAGELAVEITAVEEAYTPEIDDDWVQENTGCESLKEFKELTRDDLETEASDTADSENKQKLWDTIEENATQIKDFPEDLIEAEVETQQETAEEYAGYLGMETDEFIEENYGMTLEEYAKEEYFSKCVQDLIVEAEGLSVTEEEYQEALDSYVDGESFTSEEEVLEFMGGEDYLKEEVLYTKLDEFLTANNTFE